MEVFLLSRHLCLSTISCLSPIDFQVQATSLSTGQKSPSRQESKICSDFKQFLDFQQIHHRQVRFSLILHVVMVVWKHDFCGLWVSEHDFYYLFWGCGACYQILFKPFFCILNPWWKREREIEKTKRDDEGKEKCRWERKKMFLE
jgi:hypothetical protein